MSQINHADTHSNAQDISDEDIVVLTSGEFSRYQMRRVMWKDVPRIDIRLWWRSRVDSEWSPTKKGVLLPLKDMERIIRELIRLSNLNSDSFLPSKTP